MKKIFLFIFLIFFQALSFGVVIDIMLVFDKEAQTYANRNYAGSLDAYATEIIEEANIFYEKSNVNIELNCVKVYAWNYTSTGDSSEDLHNITYSDEIIALRNECNADMVSFITNTSSWGNVGGIAWLEKNPYPARSSLFSAINRTTGSATTFVHELGHNMGLSHSPDQTTQAGGDGLYEYSCGYHFKGGSGKLYHTIMAYNFDGKGKYYSPTKMFSSPDVIFDGVPMGTVERHNSVLSLNNRRFAIARVAYNSQISPRILEEPQSVEINSMEDSAEFVVEAENLTGLSYNWQIKESDNSAWANLSSKTSKNLSFTSSEISEKYAAKFRCVLSNSYGSTISDEVGFDFTVAPITLISSTNSEIEVFEGHSANLFVDIKETDISFQWQARRGSSWKDIEGANSAKLETQSITAKSYYRCKITRGQFVFYTPATAISVLKTAKITSTLNPENYVYTDKAIKFSVRATGYKISYKWQKYIDDDWVDIDGENGSSFSISNSSFDDEGMYRCVVENGGGKVISNIANLQVLQSAKINNVLENFEVYSGDNVKFEISAIGDNLSYQWQTSKNSTSWSNIRGEVAPTLELMDVGIKSSNTFYRCRVSNAGATVFSNASKLTVNTKAEIGKYSHYYAAKSNILYVEAKGFDLHYKWQKFEGNEWVDIGDDINTYTTSLEDLESNSKFRCIVGNTLSFENQILTDEIVAVNSTLVLSGLDENVKCYEGIKSKLSPKVENLLTTSKVLYSWLCDKNDGKGWKSAGKGTELTLNPKLNMNGWKYKFIVNNGVDVEELDFVLTVFEKLKFIEKPKSITTFEGLSNPVFTASVSGYSPNYKWQQQVKKLNEKGKLVWVWEDIEDAISSAFSPNTTLDLNNAKFRLKVSNGGMEIYSSIAKYVVREAAKISSIKVSQNKKFLDVEEDVANAIEGSAITLEASATGFAVKYKWYENGVEIKGATQKKYVIKKVFPGKYTYTCEAYNLDKKEVATSSKISVNLQIEPIEYLPDLTGQCLTFFDDGEYMFSVIFISKRMAKILNEEDFLEIEGNRLYRIYKNATATYSPDLLSFKLNMSWQEASEIDGILSLSKIQKQELAGRIDFDDSWISYFNKIEVVRTVEADIPLPINLTGAYLQMADLHIDVLADGKNCYVNGEKATISYNRISPFVATFTLKIGKKTLKDGILAISNKKLIFSYQDPAFNIGEAIIEY